MSWKPWPGRKPIGEMVSGHLYLLRQYPLFDGDSTYLLLFTRIYSTATDPDKYEFLRVADDARTACPEYCNTTQPGGWMAREVPVSDLPLYVSYPNKYPLFEKMLKGDMMVVDSYILFRV